MSLLSRFLNAFRVRRLEHDFEDELRFHLEERAAEYIRQGVTEQEAKHVARIRFGDVASIKATMLEVRMINKSFLAGVLTGILVTVAVGTIVVPATIAWMNRTPTVQFMPISDDDHTARNYYTSPLVTMRCADGRLQHTVVMSRREPSNSTIVPPAGCEIVSVRRP